MLIGVDVTVVDRIAAVLQRHPRFAARIYTPQEQRVSQGKPQRWASRWAAKEAVRKVYGAAGEKIPAYRDIEVVRRPGGVSGLRVRSEESPIALSLTHDGGLAIAVAVARERGRRHAPPSVPGGLLLPDRPDDGHKGSFGKVLVVAGSRSFTGAPRLAAMGAARGGAGLVTLCVPEAIHAVVAAGCLEVMPVPLPDAGTGTLRGEGLDTLRQRLAAADALVIGPGLGLAPETEVALLDLLRPLPCPAVVDADALTIAALRSVDWRACGQPVVLTPHPAEMARLASCETVMVQADRAGTAARYAREHGAVVVLKGAETVIAAPDGRLHLDPHRVVALATGGTGDVLSGLIGAMLAQGLEAMHAAIAGVTIHAEAGLLVQARMGRAGALAGDLLAALPLAQERLRRAIEAATAATDRR